MNPFFYAIGGAVGGIIVTSCFTLYLLSGIVPKFRG